MSRLADEISVVDDLIRKAFSPDLNKSEDACSDLGEFSRPELVAERLALVFTSPETLDRYGNVNMGLWNLFSYTIPSLMHENVSSQAILKAKKKLYSEWFATREKGELSHLKKVDLNPKPYKESIKNAEICYMAFNKLLWRNKLSGKLGKSILSLLEKILNMDSLHCQEAAIHGLEYFNSEDSRLETIRESILTRYMARTASKDLKSFAVHALENIKYKQRPNFEIPKKFEQIYGFMPLIYLEEMIFEDVHQKLTQAELNAIKKLFLKSYQASRDEHKEDYPLNTKVPAYQLLKFNYPDLAKYEENNEQIIFLSLIVKFLEKDTNTETR